MSRRTAEAARPDAHDAVYIATHEALPADGPPEIRLASQAKADQARFMVLHEERIYFEGTAAELRASDDPYLKEFLCMTLPPW